jgi:carboxypeptidase Taq
MDLYRESQRYSDRADFYEWLRNKETEDQEPGEELELSDGYINDLREEAREKTSGDKFQALLEEADDERDFLSERQERDLDWLLTEFGYSSEEVVDKESEIDEKVNGSEEGDEGVEELWTEAKNKDDFSIVEDEFEELVEAKRGYAREKSQEEDPDNLYKVLLEEYEPHLSFEEVDGFLESLRDKLTDLLEDYPDNQSVDAGLEGFDPADEIDGFEELAADIIHEMFGLPEERVRVDESVHGTEYGHQYFAPILTGGDKPWPKEILSLVHEIGHAGHKLGLPTGDQNQLFRTPTGQEGSYTLRESQARFLENHVGRSLEFWEKLKPKLDKYGIEAKPEKIHESVTGIDSENSIRVNADEITYHLHIIARYELEKGLINGDIEVDELEDEWDKKMEDYLGIDTEDMPVSEKFLQDIHWGRGKFGYFPTYTLGTAFAAQIYESNEELKEAVKDAKYEQVIDHLQQEVHQKGGSYPINQLSEEITGEEVKPEALGEYIERKFDSLYDKA